MVCPDEYCDNNIQLNEMDIKEFPHSIHIEFFCNKCGNWFSDSCDDFQTINSYKSWEKTIKK